MATTTTKSTTTRKPRTPRKPKAPAPLTVESMLETLKVVHRDNVRIFTRVKGNTGSREARIRMKQTGELLAGFGIGREDIL